MVLDWSQMPPTLAKPDLRGARDKYSYKTIYIEAWYNHILNINDENLDFLQTQVESQVH